MCERVCAVCCVLCAVCCVECVMECAVPLCPTRALLVSPLSPHTKAQPTDNDISIFTTDRWVDRLIKELRW